MRKGERKISHALDGKWWSAFGCHWDTCRMSNGSTSKVAGGDTSGGRPDLNLIQDVRATQTDVLPKLQLT